MRSVATLWDDDGVQFPRLLAELRAIGLSGTQYLALEASMDLDGGQIDELLERAENAWEEAKAAELRARRAAAGESV